MRIARLELKNFRTFGHVVLDNVPDLALFVSPNGRGKSSILEAIAGAHDLVVPYHQPNYGFQMVWQQRHLPVWPPHLASPVKLGESRAEVHIEVQATGPEVEYLQKLNLPAPTGKAHFVIEDGRHITTQQADETIKRLFQFHSPNDGVGFIDYIRPVRFYLSRKLGDFSSEMSDDRTKQAFAEFHQPYNQHEKFASFKSFVVSSQLNDFSHLQATNERRDSLALFREIFDHFFAPKRFMGYRSPVGGGEAQIVVESPFGNHDTDSLSDGEKEILHTFAHLYRFRQLHNIVLWDTPESHLNAALESRLHYAIKRIAPANQFWIATHSLEFINSVPLDNVFVIRQDRNAAKVERATGNERKTRVFIYQEMGAQVGLQLVSSVVAFVEGKQAQSDKRILDRLVAPSVPGVNFVAGGSCENILSVGTRANKLLDEACTNGDFLAIVDRDYRTDEQVLEIAPKYGGRVFMWGSHEIENLFLDPAVIAPTLSYLDKLKAGEDEASIREEMKQTASSLREWMAADWIAWEFDRGFQPPARRIAGDDPAGSLKAYAASLRDKVTAATRPENIDQLYSDKLVEVDRLISADQWVQRLPGKQILSKFLERVPSVSVQDFIAAAVSTILNKSIVVPEVERLKQALRQLAVAK